MDQFTDIIVVVHGIGDQYRNATVRSVANRLATSHRLTGGSTDCVTAPQPLGFFHNDPKGPVICHFVDQHSRLGQMPLNQIGVAEVYWADIPQEIVDEAHTLDETKEWAGTVMARARALFNEAKAAHLRKQAAGEPVAKLVEPDFYQAADTLEEMIDTIRVLENLFLIADKAGVFTFDLKEVLDMYLGDVQVVAEFGYHRTNIVGRFHKAMEDVYTAAKDAGKSDVRLHIVAHSEGTVVSFLGLLQAMSKRQVTPEDDKGEAEIKQLTSHPPWLERVAGYMTLGSPIDKHLLLWPHLWDGLDPKLANGLLATRPIKWHNYYDYGDPVGFKLDTARAWMKEQDLKSFEFTEEKHDHGFARYLLPGAAHNEYWNDPDVFEHFVTNVVVQNDPAPKSAPKSRRTVYVLSPLIPYVLSFALLLLGTYLLYKQVAGFSHPEPEALEAAELSRLVDITPIAALNGWPFFRSVLGVTFLVAGATLISRVPRMMLKGPKRLLIMVGGFVASCAAYWLLLERESRDEIGSVFVGLGENGPTIGVLVVALVTGLFGLSSLVGHGSKRTRWFWRGMRPMIAVGAVGIAAIVLGRVYCGGAPLTAAENAFLEQKYPGGAEAVKDQIAEARMERQELDQFFLNGDFKSPRMERHLQRLPEALPLLNNRPPLWPVALAAAAFLYLWWLATLIFDLAFIWQRYVRNSVSNRRLLSWYQTKRGISAEEDGRKSVA